MPAYIPSQEEERVVLQQYKEVYLKVDLLNDDFTINDSFTGVLVSDNFSMNSDSKQRRTYNCTLIVKDHTFLIGQDNKIWFDKYIRPYYGIKNIRTNTIHYWLLGTFVYVSADYTWSATECNLSLQCADMMALYDGTRDGIINQNRYNEISGDTAYGFKIPQVSEYETDSTGKIKTDGYGNRIVKTYNKISDQVRALCDWAGIHDYQVEDYPSGRDIIPYDMDYSGDVTYCQIWTDLAELYPNWEFYFDKNGTFIWQKIPTGYDEPISLENWVLSEAMVSENQNNNFGGIYNVTEVWGKTFELTNEDRYANSSSYNSSTNTYTIQLSLVMKDGTTDKTSPLSYFVNGDRIAIKIKNTNKVNPKIIIQSTSGNTLTTMPIVDGDGNGVKAGEIPANTICVFTYRQNIKTSLQSALYFNGHTQAYGIYYATDTTQPGCPFTTDKIGPIVRKLSMEKLYSDELCYNQAQYETYYTTAMMDTVTLNTIIIPWLEPNTKVEYASKTSGNTEQYIIKSVSWSTFDGTMQLTMYKFIEDFEYVYNRG